MDIDLRHVAVSTRRMFLVSSSDRYGTSRGVMVSCRLTRESTSDRNVNVALKRVWCVAVGVGMTHSSDRMRHGASVPQTSTATPHNLTRST
jgi:hypothetical protein